MLVRNVMVMDAAQKSFITAEDGEMIVRSILDLGDAHND